MKKATLTTLVIAMFAAVAIAGCAAKEPQASARNGASWSAQQLIASARLASEKSDLEGNRSKARSYAEEGIDAAERCLMVAPEEPGCYYWRAVNTGLFHRVHVIGYQRGVKRMIDDCKRVIELSPGYEHAGAYRILGELYTKLPQTGGTTESVTRDLPLAESYLREAVRIAPDYPENYILLAETLLAQDNVRETSDALRRAESLAPHWKGDISYNVWKNSMFALEKKVKKAEK